MTTERLPSYEQVLATVTSWPAEKRFDLVHAILRTLDPDSATPQERGEAFQQLRGALKVENPPSDEDVRRWLDEHRMAKYG